ncbi:MAG: DMT family transporter, partial [Steroidobacteraceae bacterium]
MVRAVPAPAVIAALAAAVLFGASTPLAKQLLQDASPMLLAGLLYLGSGIGLSAGRLLRDRGWSTPALSPAEWRWVLLAIGFGGVLGPLLLMSGLARMAAASASLLLNLEAVLTALLAWIVFRENNDRRVVLGMALIVAGAAALCGRGGALASGSGWGASLIALACLCWALDNNLTRKASASDAVFLAALKGIAAGVVNTGLALLLGERLPGPTGTAEAMMLGLLGYGVSLVLFVLALRGLGAARTGAYFS